MKKFFAILLLFFVFHGFTVIAEDVSVERQLSEENGQWIYTVNERAPTVWRIGIELYGTSKYTNKIIQWNNLKEPYTLSVGQKLTLKEEPKLSANQGTEKLIVWWQGQKNEAMVKRLQATLFSADIVSVQPETNVVAIAPPIEANSEPKVDEKISTEDIQIKEQTAKPAEPPAEKPIEAPAEQQQVEAEVKAETQSTEPEPAKSTIENFGIEVRGGTFVSYMNTKDTLTTETAKLESQPGFTVDVDLHWRFTENYAAFLQGGWSYLMWGPPKQVSLTNMERNSSLFSGFIGGEWKPLENIAGRLSGGMKQTAFFSGSTSRYGLQTLTINVPAVRAEAYWYFAAVQATWYFPTTINNIEFNNGQGFAVGIDNSLFSKDWTWRLMYEWRNQDSKDIEVVDQGAVATVGYNFGSQK